MERLSGKPFVRKNIIYFMILRLPDFPKKRPCFFWKLFSQPLKKERKACQDGRREARRTNRFE